MYYLAESPIWSNARGNSGSFEEGSFSCLNISLITGSFAKRSRAFAISGVNNSSLRKVLSLISWIIFTDALRKIFEV